MDAERCVSCGRVIPEGRMICPICEQKEMKYGSILQSQNATAEQVQEVYDGLFANPKEEEGKQDASK